MTSGGGGVKDYYVEVSGHFKLRKTLSATDEESALESVLDSIDCIDCIDYEVLDTDVFEVENEYKEVVQLEV